MRSERLGFASLAAVVGLLALLALLGATQLFLAGDARTRGARRELVEAARGQASAAVEELRAGVAAAANQPDHRVFRRLRLALDAPWSRLDLTPDLDPPALDVAPRHGRVGEEPGARVATRVLSHQVTLESPRSVDAASGSEELVALLTLDVRAEARDRGGRFEVRRVARFELRISLAGPPRPFDQVALYLGRASGAVDMAAGAAARGSLLERHARLLSRLGEVARAGGPGSARARQLAGLMDPREVAARLPDPWSRGAPSMFGPYHLDEGFEGAYLDRAAATTRELAALDRAEAALEAAVAGGRDAGRPAEQAVATLDLALGEAWRFSWHFSLQSPTEPGRGRQLAPYLERLSPGYFLARVHRRLAPTSPWTRRWLAGEARLDGVLDMRSDDPLELSGTYAGRTTLVVGPGPVRLRALTPSDPEGLDDRLVLVALGADVTVEGRVTAAVVLAPGAAGGSSGRFRLARDALLEGALLAPDPPPGSVELAGTLRHDPRLQAPWPPSRTLALPGAGHYVVVVAPVPLFAHAVASGGTS